MVTVSSRELKNRLGKYLRLVRDGEPVEITDRGRPIARIVPVEGSGTVDEDLLRLLAKGNVTLGHGRLRKRKPAVLTPGPSIAEMIAEDRR
jgi:prevent-host-death family protein